MNSDNIFGTLINSTFALKAGIVVDLKPITSVCVKRGYDTMVSEACEYGVSKAQATFADPDVIALAKELQETTASKLPRLIEMRNEAASYIKPLTDKPAAFELAVAFKQVADAKKVVNSAIKKRAKDEFLVAMKELFLSNHPIDKKMTLLEGYMSRMEKASKASNGGNSQDEE